MPVTNFKIWPLFLRNFEEENFLLIWNGVISSIEKMIVGLVLESTSNTEMDNSINTEIDSSVVEGRMKPLSSPVPVFPKV